MKLMAIALLVFVGGFLGAILLNRALWGYWGVGDVSVISEAVRRCPSSRWCAVRFETRPDVGLVMLADKTEFRVGRVDERSITVPACELSDHPALQKRVRSAVDAAPGERCRQGLWAVCTPADGRVESAVLSCTSAPLEDNDRYLYVERLIEYVSQSDVNVVSSASRYVEESGLEGLSFRVLLIFCVLVSGLVAFVVWAGLSGVPREAE